MDSVIAVAFLKFESGAPAHGLQTQANQKTNKGIQCRNCHENIILMINPTMFVVFVSFHKLKENQSVDF